MNRPVLLPDLMPWLISQISGRLKLPIWGLLAVLLIATKPLLAQDELIGLTSTGGAQGAGTAFSIKSNGQDFNIWKTFVQSGHSPHGDLIRGNDGNFYGMTTAGGANHYGTIFKVTPNGTITILLSLDYYITGGNPKGGLVLGSDGNFYGTTSNYGASGYGTIFKFSPGGAFTLLRNFNSNIDGRNPTGNLVQGTDGNFYGLTEYGGTNNHGTVFKITPNGIFTVLKNLDENITGAYPKGSLVKGPDGNFYGMTYQGGTNGYGTIFRISPNGTLTVRHHFDYTNTGGRPNGSLLLTSNGSFYGMTSQGGANSTGTIIRMTLNGSVSVLRSFNYSLDGGYPQGSLVQGANGQLYGATTSGGQNSDGTIFKISTGGTYSVMHHLNYASEGKNPQGRLAIGTDGSFYGMNAVGGPGNQGTVFKITASGAYSVLAGFPESSKGQSPVGSLIQARNGNFYGLTSSGGTFNDGSVFKLCSDSYSTVTSLNSTLSGSTPRGSLVQGADGNFYGMAQHGGQNGYGTIYKISGGGSLTVLRHLAYGTDGGNPQGNLIQAPNGVLYGMTYRGGTSGYGTIFKITTAGTFTVLKHLDNTNTGGNPYGSLVQGTDGNLYGMTSQGGTNNYGTIFKITPGGTLTVLYNLDGTNDGSYPRGNLIQARNGNFYGMTYNGGIFNDGTVFRITPAGTFTVLHHLDDVNDGSRPEGSLVQGSDNNLYGFTTDGGFHKNGTVFKITLSGTFTVLRQLNPATDGGKPLGSLLVRQGNPVANAQNITTVEETAKAITLTGTGGSPLQYTIIDSPKNGTLTGSGANRTYKPKANFSGQDSFTFKVIWGCQSSATKTVSITVTNVNDAPVLASIGDKTATIGSKVSFTAKATDPDAGQTNTFSLVSAPAGASINATSGVFNWTPANSGSYTFKVKVTDNGTPTLFDEEAITISVSSNAELAFRNSKVPAEIESESKRSVNLYPNPVLNQFTVTLPVPATNVTSSIINTTGAEMIHNGHQRRNENELQFDVTQLKAGLYILDLQLDLQRHRVKFIKE